MSKTNKQHHETRPQLIALLNALEKVRRAHAALHALALRSQAHVGAPGTSQADRVDVAYLMRQIETHLDDSRKVYASVAETTEEIVCAIWAAQPVDADGKAQTGPVRGQIARGTPNVRIAARLPSSKKEPEKFAKVMSALGVDTSSPAFAAGAVRAHWPGLVEHLTRLAAEARPLPPGIDPNDTYPVSSLSPLCKREDVDLTTLLGPDHAERAPGDDEGGADGE